MQGRMQLPLLDTRGYERAGMPQHCAVGPSTPSPGAATLSHRVQFTILSSQSRPRPGHRQSCAATGRPADPLTNICLKAQRRLVFRALLPRGASAQEPAAQAPRARRSLSQPLLARARRSLSQPLRLQVGPGVTHIPASESAPGRRMIYSFHMLGDSFSTLSSGS